ncbi:50S ribosomal protein L25 [Candidatus Palibaumannia cicadellinicola]|uniref:Large ribosomal subunit protein bL25 n=1 Tax=Baumannia cicadellinicola subsp. Homalodisca coagulata TaxID=374463 RepID=Q1LT81_BAUCH|nr:50S ribosomal protein L25 [Candidatus Baumannia cicadellinicola]ABF13884.1 50S ribosomal protein L25 [Baumannia cicadellinicola str. Hc (Homalodisca coagulata)]MCJ7462126.1 50S ribosomal protein L25 [Candidatus Baumannia cicadellinicola]MCJ7462705.1 50S ribosomal protein L25 [Candidatus Baumannia cicadellinicola]
MLTLQAENRKKTGTRASNRLRIAGKLPAILYGGNTQPIAIELDSTKYMHIKNQISLDNDLLALVINGKIFTVKVWAIQHHPFKPQITHIDFIRV